MAMLKKGDTVPDFTLPDDGGATVTLSDLRGKPLVVYFYPKDDTSSCTKEALDFSCLRPQFDTLGIKVIGISPDSIDKHRKFRSKHALDISLLADEDKSTLDAYGVWIEKSMYGRKYMGVERTTVLVDADGKIAEIWHKVKVPGHAEAVLKAVQNLVAELNLSRQFVLSVIPSNDY